MIVGLVAGFGAPLQHLMGDLGSRKWIGIRQGCVEPHTFTPEPGLEEPEPDLDRLMQLIAEFSSPVAKQYGLNPLWIATLKTLPHLPPGSWATFHNEPNLHGYAVGPLNTEVHPAYIRDVKEALRIARDRHIRLYIGGASNTTLDCMEWTRNVLREVPEAEAVEFHDYGGPDGDPAHAHTGCPSRRECFQRLVGLCEGRPLIIGEFGVRNVEGVTEWQQADYLRGGFELYRSFDIVGAYVYQLHDGVYPYWWGIRREDFTWKPSSEVAAEFAGEPYVDKKIVGLKLRGKFIGVDPAIPDVVYTDRETLGAWEEMELRLREDGKYNLHIIAANRSLRVDDLGNVLTWDADDTTAWQTFYGAELPPDWPGMIISVNSAAFEVVYK